MKMKCLLFAFLLFSSALGAESLESLIKSYPKATAQEILKGLLVPTTAPQDYDKAVAHLKKAAQAQEKGDAEEAFRENGLAAAAFPRDWWYFNNLAQHLLWNLKDPQAALDFARASLALKPNPWAELNEALAHQRLSRPSEAEKGFLAALSSVRAALAALPPPAEAERQSLVDHRKSVYGFFVQFLYDSQRFDQALERSREALAADPESVDWYLANGGGLSAFWLGNRSLGARDYDKAAGYYRRAIELLKKNTDLWKAHSSSDLEGLLRWTEVRRQLGEVVPATRFRILLTILRHADVKFTNQRGQVIQGKTEVLPEQLSGLRDGLGVLGPLCEAFSGGRFTVEFEETTLDATVRGIEVSTFTELGKNTEIHATDLQRIDPPLGPLWKQNLDRFDGFAVFWNSSGLVEGGNGGLTAYPLVPYTLSGPLRAMMNVPLGLNVQPGTYLFFFHELFHNIEALADIKPVHGFRDGVRESFPQWKGKTELDYYAWQFQNHLPKLKVKDARGGELAGFQALNCLARWPAGTGSVYDAIVEGASRIPPGSRKTAKDLTEQANKLFFEKNDHGAAAGLYRKALGLNPWIAEAWVRLGQEASERQDQAKALEYFKKPAEWGSGWWETLQYANLLRDHKKDLTAAEAYYAKANTLALLPEEKTQVFYHWADHRRMAGDVEGSLELYTRSMDSNSKKDDSFYRWAWFWRVDQRLVHLKDRESGFRDLEQMALAGPMEGWYFDHLVYEVLWEQKDLVWARKILGKALETVTETKSRADACYNLGRLSWEEKKAQEALEWFRKTVKEGGQGYHLTAETWFWAGLVTGDGLKDYEKGLAIIEKAIRDGYDNDFSRYYLNAWRKMLKE